MLPESNTGPWRVNTVSLRVRSTYPPNCAHIILIRSAESSVWNFINMLLFHVEKLFSWFSKYVSYFEAHIYVDSCVVSTREKISLNITTNRYQFVSSNDSNKNTNVKSEISKLSTNKICHFLEIIMLINQTSEHHHSNTDGHTRYTTGTAENYKRDAN
jgi:hypothetical protein